MNAAQLNQAFGGCWRKLTARRFQPLMLDTAMVRSTSSSSLNSTRTAAKSSSDTWEVGSVATDSLQASAAFSRAVKNGESRHTHSANKRRSVSPRWRAAIECMSVQKPQWLSCETRILINSSNGCSIDRPKVFASSINMALSACGEAV